MSYLYDPNENLSFQEVQSSSLFKPFQNNLNKGLNNGVYWVKLETNQGYRTVEIPTNHVEVQAFYTQNKRITTYKNTLHTAYPLARGVNYIKIKCSKEAYIPIRIIKDYQRANSLSFWINGLYYGVALMIFVFNLLYFFNFKERTFLYYSLFLAFITLSLFLRDGLFQYFFDATWLTTYGETIFHSGVAIMGAIFASEYLNHKEHLPKLKWISIALCCLLLVTYSIYLVSHNYLFFALGEVICLTTLGMYLISGFILFKKNSFSKFFTIAYLFIFLFAYDFYVAPIFGIPNLVNTTNPIKVAGAIEMIVISFAVVYRMRILHYENKQIKQELFEHTSQIEELEDQLNKLKEGKTNNITISDLSKREIEILTLISKGASNQEISDALFISINTVKYHTKKLYEKLKINSRKEAKKKAIEIWLTQ